MCEYAPDLQGLHTEGDDIDEAVAQEEEALAPYVEGSLGDGQEVRRCSKASLRYFVKEFDLILAPAFLDKRFHLPYNCTYKGEQHAQGQKARVENRFKR